MIPASARAQHGKLEKHGGKSGDWVVAAST